MNYKYFFLFFTLSLFSKSEDTPPSLKEGNLLLSASQQPSPLFGFGQNIVDKHDFQLYFYTDYIKQKIKEQLDVMPGFLYGIRDNLSLYCNVPITGNLKTKKNEDAGCETVLPGLSAQIEYAYFSKTFYDYALQATLVSALSGPNGSMIKQATTNRQTSTFFIGGTFSYLQVDWYFYSSLGGLFTIKTKSNNALGDNFLYQSGLGRNLHHSDKYTYLALVEVLGTKFKADVVEGEVDIEGGGNIIFIAPSFWFSSARITAQLGAAIPIYQKVSNSKNKYSYQIAFNGSWKF